MSVQLSVTFPATSSGPRYQFNNLKRGNFSITICPISICLSADSISIPGHAVAFYAFLNHVESSPSKHHTVIFDNVVTNIESAYSPNTGVFTAPINGVFVFNWNLYSGYRGVLISNLMVNSDNKGGRRSDSTTSDEDHSSSGCLVVALHQGDEVFVITHSTHSIKGPIISYPGFYESSFSGWLLA